MLRRVDSLLLLRRGKKDFPSGEIFEASSTARIQRAWRFNFRLICTHLAVPAVQIPPFPPASSDHTFD
jgi:hypothetical protein